MKHINSCLSNEGYLIRNPELILVRAQELTF